MCLHLYITAMNQFKNVVSKNLRPIFRTKFFMINFRLCIPHTVFGINFMTSKKILKYLQKIWILQKRLQNR